MTILTRKYTKYLEISSRFWKYAEIRLEKLGHISKFSEISDNFVGMSGNYLEIARNFTLGAFELPTFGPSKRRVTWPHSMLQQRCWAATARKRRDLVKRNEKGK